MTISTFDLSCRYGRTRLSPMSGKVQPTYCAAGSMRTVLSQSKQKHSSHRKKFVKYLTVTLTVICVDMLSSTEKSLFSDALAASFQSPIIEGSKGQPYACKGQDPCHTPREYHTGIDMTPSDGAVRAVGAGFVKRIPMGTYARCNHGMGNVVIIKHVNGIYSIYAHLETIDVPNDREFVTQGERIGTYGRKGYTDDCPTPAPKIGAHLHFELKAWDVMGSVHDDLSPAVFEDLSSVFNEKERAVNQWGYTPLYPNQHGYIDPRPYLDLDVVSIAPTVVEVSNPSVRSGPDDGTDEFARAEVGQKCVAFAKFVAFAKHQERYQVYLPSLRGAATGWVRGVVAAADTILEVADPERVTISRAGVFVRPDSGDYTRALSRVWDGQWLVQTDQAPPTGDDRCGNFPWYKTYLPLYQTDPDDSSAAREGWVCGSVIRVHKACLNSFTAAEPTPNGNGAAYNVLSTEKELLVQAGCNETTVDVLVGSGRPNQYVYRYGYERKGTKWQQFRLSGPPVQGNSDWFVGDGFAELTRTAAQLAGNNFVLAYICTWTGAEWKCGCRDNACTQSFWQLQNFWGQ